MGALLDVMFSMIMGGMLLLNVIRAQELVYENTSEYQGDVLVQEMLITQVQYLEGEIRNMGYGVEGGVCAVVFANDSTISFMIDADRNGIIDTVQYSVGPVSELSRTENEMDRFLKRTMRTPTSSITSNVGVVTFFHFRYYAVTGDTLASPVSAGDLGRINEVEVNMEVQNPWALYRPPGMVSAGERNALYSTSYWQQTRLASQNFRR